MSDKHDETAAEVVRRMSRAWEATAANRDIVAAALREAAREATERAERQIPLGTVVRERRVARRLTLAAVAKECEITAADLSEIEHCRTLPAPRVLLALATVLGMDVDRLHFLSAQRCLSCAASQERAERAQAELARIVAERDTLRAENAALREVVEAARPALNSAYHHLMHWALEAEPATLRDVNYAAATRVAAALSRLDALTHKANCKCGFPHGTEDALKEKP